MTMVRPDLGPQLELDLRFTEIQDQAAHLGELGQHDLESAFEIEPTNVCSCVDEGAKDGKLRIAGAGILHPGGVDAVADLLRDQGIAEVSSHDHCGAAKSAYFSEHGLSADATVAQADIDAFARDWAEEVAAKAGIRATHQASTELQRPPDYHEAGAVYILGQTGDRTFKQRAVDNLPPGFVVSADGLSLNVITNTVAFVDGIARGDHGFGPRFSSQQPFRYVVIGDIGEELRARLTARVEADESLAFLELPVPLERQTAYAEGQS